MPGLTSSVDDEDDEDGDDTPANGTEATVAKRARHARRRVPVHTRAAVQRPIVRSLLVGLAILLVAAAGLGAGYAWTRTQYFVGAAGDQVAIYQGLPDGIPGLQLSQVYEVQDLPVASCRPTTRTRSRAGIEVASVDAARVTVEQLSEMARRCAEPTPAPSPGPPQLPRRPRLRSPPQHLDHGRREAVRSRADPDPHDLHDAGAPVDVGHARAHHACAQPAPRAGLLIVRVAR